MAFPHDLPGIRCAFPTNAAVSGRAPQGLKGFVVKPQSPLLREGGQHTTPSLFGSATQQADDGQNGTTPLFAAVSIVLSIFVSAKRRRPSRRADVGLASTKRTQITKTELGPNVEFYRNQLVTSYGSISTMHGWKGDYMTLEENHAYIQWLFPNYYSSRYNPEAHALTPEEARVFREDPDIARRYLDSYLMFLDFLGLHLLDPETGAVGRLHDGECRLHAALVLNPHNQLRVQRVLASLAVTGFERYVAPFASYLEWEVTGFNQRVLSSAPVSDWRALQKPALQQLAGGSRFLDSISAIADGNPEHYQQMTKSRPADVQESVIFEEFSADPAVNFRPIADLAEAWDGRRQESIDKSRPKQVAQEPEPQPRGSFAWAIEIFDLTWESRIFKKSDSKSPCGCHGPQKPGVLSGIRSCFVGSSPPTFAGHGRARCLRARLAAAPSDCHGTPPGEQNVVRRSDLIKRFQLPEPFLDGRYDWSYADSGPGPYARGGADYFPPYGFDKLGLSTVKFDDWSFMDRESGWHVAYHGTDPEDIAPIINEGLKAKGGRLHPKHGAKYGDGIYLSPEPATAQQFAGELRSGEQNVETDIVLMARVKPASYTVHENGRVWLVENPDDIRCHSVLFARK